MEIVQAIKLNSELVAAIDEYRRALVADTGFKPPSRHQTILVILENWAAERDAKVSTKEVK